MENNETITATINKISEKTSKAGRKYSTIETDKGNFSCFENDIVKGLNQQIGKQVLLSIATSEDGKFKNVRSWDNAKQMTFAEQARDLMTADKFAEAREVKNQSIYTSYAKDVFIALAARKPADKEVDATALMNASIVLVKQAKEAFKEA
ncbi:MAG: hypothetical protein EHM12_10300 [Dehalococcoidia bacterium]|nr:MAG: hypothetical protein EHM12_10300 [Dehalococcoidia bacterium]